MNDTIEIIFHNLKNVANRITDVFNEISQVSDKAGNVNDDLRIITVIEKKTSSHTIKKPSNELEGFLFF